MQALTAVEQDPDQINGHRLILLSTDATYRFFNLHYSGLKGSEAGLQFARDMAAEKWMKVNRDTWACMQNVKELERAGFTVSFSAETIAKLPTLASQIKYEDTLAHNLGTMVQTLSTANTSSFCRYSEYYPDKLAGILSDDEAEVAECMEEFGLDVKAWRRASDPTPTF